MAIVIGTIGSTPSTSLTLDLDALTSRVARLLRRSDIDSEIQQWLNFSQRELVDRVNFPELRSSSYTILDPNAPEPWKLTLPSDFAREDRIYYLDITVSPSWGRRVIPLPRYFYDNTELERLLNISSPTVGDPRNYLIQGTELYLYPSPNKASRIELTYYRLPNDMTLGGHVPDISARWRHYLIPLAYYWGQIFLEKEDPNKVLLWERKFEKTIGQVKRVVNRMENRVMAALTPPTGLEEADRIY